MNTRVAVDQFPRSARRSLTSTSTTPSSRLTRADLQIDETTRRNRRGLISTSTSHHVTIDEGSRRHRRHHSSRSTRVELKSTRPVVAIDQCSSISDALAGLESGGSRATGVIAGAAGDGATASAAARAARGRPRSAAVTGARPAAAASAAFPEPHGPWVAAFFFRGRTSTASRLSSGRPSRWGRGCRSPRDSGRCRATIREGCRDKTRDSRSAAPPRAACRNSRPTRGTTGRPARPSHPSPYPPAPGDVAARPEIPTYNSYCPPAGASWARVSRAGGT